MGKYFTLNVLQKHLCCCGDRKYLNIEQPSTWAEHDGCCGNTHPLSYCNNLFFTASEQKYFKAISDSTLKYFFIDKMFARNRAYILSTNELLVKCVNIKEFPSRKPQTLQGFTEPWLQNDKVKLNTGRTTESAFNSSNTEHCNKMKKGRENLNFECQF